jgi:cell shape-determining protein MreC
MSEVIVASILSFATAVIGWLIGRRKTSAETTAIEIGNVDKAVKIWQNIADELRQDLTVLIKENAEMKQEIKKLEIKVQSLMRENKKLRELLEKNGLTQ